MDDIGELFQQYLDKNKFWHFEGERGVRHVTQIVSDIGGYRSLDDFLVDNPAACEALVEFVREFLQRTPEWREDLIALMGDGEEEE